MMDFKLFAVALVIAHTSRSEAAIECQNNIIATATYDATCDACYVTGSSDILYTNKGCKKSLAAEAMKPVLTDGMGCVASYMGVKPTVTCVCGTAKCNEVSSSDVDTKLPKYNELAKADTKDKKKCMVGIATEAVSKDCYNEKFMGCYIQIDTSTGVAVETKGCMSGPFMIGDKTVADKTCQTVNKKEFCYCVGTDCNASKARAQGNTGITVYASIATIASAILAAKLFN